MNKEEYFPLLPLHIYYKCQLPEEAFFSVLDGSCLDICRYLESITGEAANVSWQRADTRRNTVGKGGSSRMTLTLSLGFSVLGYAFPTQSPQA